MTKRDYIAIAAMVRNTYTDDEAGTAALREFAEKFANHAKEQNSRFNREIFLTACGFGE